MVTRRNVVNGLAPRSRAASSIDGSRVSTRARTTTATNDSENMMCAIMIVGSPRPTLNVTNMDSSEAPSTISGAEMQANISRLNDAWPRNRYLPRAMPISAPSSTDTTVVTDAISSEYPRALVRSWLAVRFDGRYHLNVKPCQAVL